MLRERVRVDRRDHHIVAAVHDQRRLADPLQLGEAVVARAKPGLHRRELRTDCPHPGRDVLVLGAAMAPLPELLAGLAPGIRRREEEIEKGLERTVAGLFVGRARMKDRKSTRLNSRHKCAYRKPSSA